MSVLRYFGLAPQWHPLHVGRFIDVLTFYGRDGSRSVWRANVPIPIIRGDLWGAWDWIA